MDLLAALLQEVLPSEDGGVALHGLLHLSAELCCRVRALGVSEMIELSNALLTSISSQFWLSLTGSELLHSCLGGAASEHDQIEERVGSESVGAVDGGTGSLATGEEATDVGVLAVFVGGDDLGFPVGGDTSHVVVDGGENGDGFFGGVNASENMRSLENTGETLLEGLWGQVVQMEVHVVSILTDSTSLKDLHGHRPGNDISRGQILSGRCITLHESLAVLVAENSTFTAAALSHQAPSAVDAGRVELDELGVLDGEAGSGDHTATITGAGMGGRAALVGTAVPTGGHDGLVGAHAVDSSVRHVVGHDSTDRSIVTHQKIHGEVLHEENAVVAKSTTEQGVEHAVTGTVSNTAAAVGLSAGSVLLGLATESALVDLTLGSARKGHAVGLEFSDSHRRLSGHVLNGVLVSEPVCTLHGVIKVPPPVIIMHVAECGVDTALGSNGVRTRGEQFRDTGSLETSLSEAEGSAESGATGTDDDGVVGVVDNGVVTDGFA